MRDEGVTTINVSALIVALSGGGNVMAGTGMGGLAAKGAMHHGVSALHTRPTKVGRSASIAFWLFSFHFKRIDFHLQLQGGGKSTAIQRVGHGNQRPGGLVDFTFKAADLDRHFRREFRAAT